MAAVSSPWHQRRMRTSRHDTSNRHDLDANRSSTTEHGEGLRSARSLPSPTSTPRRRSPGRPRGLDVFVLRWLAEVRAATTQTTVTRFWTNAGKSSSYGYDVVARLCADGFVRADWLISGLGRASPQVLTLTPSGWAEVGLKAPHARTSPAVSAEQRDAWCQLAATLTERQATGWTVFTGAEAWAALRRVTLARYRLKALTGTEVVLRTRVERMPPAVLPCPVLWHAGDLAARLVIHVMPHRALRPWLNRLADLRLLAPLDLEVVCRAALIDDVQTVVRRWAAARRMKVQQHYGPPFIDTPNPRLVAATGFDRYKATTGKTVHQLVRAPI